MAKKIRTPQEAEFAWFFDFSAISGFIDNEWLPKFLLDGSYGYPRAQCCQNIWRDWSGE